MWNHKPPSITPRLSAWAQALFPHLRRTFRTNLALFLSTLLRHTPPRPTLSAYARSLPLPYSAQAKLNRLWRFLRHPALQNPWILTRALLPLLAPRAAKGKLLPCWWTGPHWRMESIRLWSPPYP
ncbi:hypothetical protein TTHNP3_00004 (plasmid) [Thermus thermophilus]|uniref:Uncharacterized protein n=1 Tax=Thermus thermophilus TaxID=274 RepID=A0A3P4ATN9_THETH|nr:hypothetical protein TTHNP3_00004 [Thermus thermophilus]